MLITRGKTKFYILILGFQAVLLLIVVFSVNTISAMATTTTTTGGVIDQTSNGYDIAAFLAIGSALAVGLSVLGAGIAIKTTGTAAISVLTEQPEAFFKAFLVVALGEALAIYGLIVAILLWMKIPAFTLS